MLARGVKRMFAVALAQYRQVLDERSVLDFADVLDRALELLRRMDEFSQSRFRLEARYHHVLVDEFQDTSRAQWELVALLIQSWGEGTGVTTNPSIFVVGDRKQSIYRFRDAEAAVLQEAARHIQALRPAGNPRRSITKSFRALPTLLAFVNELFAEMADPEPGGGRFTYTESDRFPTTATRRHSTTEQTATDNTDQTRTQTTADRGAGSRLGLRRPTIRSSARASSRTRSSGFCARTACAIGRPACRGGRRRAISACCSGRAPATASSSASSSAAGSRPTSTRAWASSTPTRRRTRWR